MIKKFLVPVFCALVLAGCSGFDTKIVEDDFKKKCPECKIVEVVSEECQDGSILACYLVKINYTKGSDSLQSVMCQYIKGDSGWHLVE